MRRLLLIAKRDYIASVRTKAFMVGLLVAPVLFGGGLVASALLRGHGDKQARRVVIVDETGTTASNIEEAVAERTKREGADKQSGAQVLPRYEFEIAPADTGNREEQLLELSNRVRSKGLFAFMQVSAGGVKWYSNSGGFGETERWMTTTINEAVRRQRLERSGVRGKELDAVLRPVPLESMNLLRREANGHIVPARKRGMAESFAAPFGIAVAFFMIVLLVSAPMLSAVAEDKAQRVFEMLLVSATAFELIGGKVVAAIGVALTSSICYLAGAAVLLQGMAMTGLVPLSIVPWFFLYLVAEVMILASLATALGAACSSSRDAENLKLIVLMPAMIPVLFLTPVIQEPNGAFAIAMSFFPLFTPILMLVRQAAPGGVPWWQPCVGMAGAAATAMVISWMASRIFRVAILSQGKTPNVGELLRWGWMG